MLKFWSPKGWVLTGGGGSKGTINWPGTVHSFAFPEENDVEKRLFLALGPPPPLPEVGLRGVSIQLKGHGYFIHSEKKYKNKK